MSNTDIQLLVAQARSEADNPAFKVRIVVLVSRCRLDERFADPPPAIQAYFPV